MYAQFEGEIFTYYTIKTRTRINRNYSAVKISRTIQRNETNYPLLNSHHALIIWKNFITKKSN